MTRHGLARVLVAIVFGCFAAASAASAQYDGTQAEQDACTPDVFRLCQAYIPDEKPIVACLKLNRTSLSPACSQVFFPMKADASGRLHKRRVRQPQ